MIPKYRKVFQGIEKDEVKQETEKSKEKRKQSNGMRTKMNLPRKIISHPKKRSVGSLKWVNSISVKDLS